MNRTVRVRLCAGILAGIAMGAPHMARAAGTPVLTGAYLFSDWSSPTAVTSLYVPPHPVGAPPAPSSFGFHGTSGVELLLNGSTVTGISNSGPVTLEIDQALTYDSHVGSIDGGNVRPPAADTVNREVGTWDDAGIVAEHGGGGGDSARNLDYDRPTWRRGPAGVRFNPVGGSGVPGYHALIIAEDAAFDPFGLSICSGASGGDCQSIISSFDSDAIDSISGPVGFRRRRQQRRGRNGPGVRVPVQRSRQRFHLGLRYRQPGRRAAGSGLHRRKFRGPDSRCRVAAGHRRRGACDVQKA